MAFFILGSDDLVITRETNRPTMEQNAVALLIMGAESISGLYNKC